MHQYPGNHLVSLSELQKINQRAWRIFFERPISRIHY